MLVRDYFGKYGLVLTPKLDQETAEKVGMDIYLDFAKELVDRFNAYVVKSDAAYDQLVKDINYKWNHLGEMFIKRYGIPMLQTNGFQNICEKVYQDEKEKRKCQDSTEQ